MMSGNVKNAPEVTLSLSIRCVAGQWKEALPAYRRLVRKWCIAALSGKQGELTIVLADDDMVRELNHTYRGKNKPTNVLSFTGSGTELGDIILSYSTLAQEAEEQHKSFEQHAAHLVVHGCLHLQGYDHEENTAATLMEGREKQILALLGYPDPYKL